jgi:hypothetical protein
LIPILGKIATTASMSHINNLQRTLSNCSKAVTIMTGNGYDVLDKYKTCEACSLAKARQKKVSKDWNGGSVTAEERLYVDISTIKGEIYGGSKLWALAVNDKSRYCWSYFLNCKRDLQDKLSNCMTALLKSGLEYLVKYSSMRRPE